MNLYDIKRISDLAQELAALLEDNFEFNYHCPPEDLISELEDVAYAAEMSILADKGE